MKHSRTRQPDKANPLLNLHARTEQDGDWSHHTAAEGEDDATGCVGTVGRSDGDVEIECVEDPSSAQKRSQDRQESGNAARVAAFTLAAALSTLRGLLGSLAGLRPALWPPHRQLHALRGRAYQRSTLVRGAVNTGGFWAASCGVQAVGKASLRGCSGAADTVFCGGVRTLRCGDVGAADILIPLLLFGDICSWLLREVVCGLLMAESKACSKQIRIQHQTRRASHPINTNNNQQFNRLKSLLKSFSYKKLPQVLNPSILSNEHRHFSAFKHPVGRERISEPDWFWLIGNAHKAIQPKYSQSSHNKMVPGLSPDPVFCDNTTRDIDVSPDIILTLSGHGFYFEYFLHQTVKKQ